MHPLFEERDVFEVVRVEKLVAVEDHQAPRKGEISQRFRMLRVDLMDPFERKVPLQRDLFQSRSHDMEKCIQGDVTQMHELIDFDDGFIEYFFNLFHGSPLQNTEFAQEDQHASCSEDEGDRTLDRKQSEDGVLHRLIELSEDPCEDECDDDRTVDHELFEPVLPDVLHPFDGIDDPHDPRS